MIINIEPTPAPRMTQSDKYRKRPCVMRYRAFCDELRLYVKEVKVPLWIEFQIAMPRSWSEKKKLAMDGKPHTYTPDVDNLLKAFMDALLNDDSHVHEIHARKRWARKSAIVIDEEYNGSRGL